MDRYMDRAGVPTHHRNNQILSPPLIFGIERDVLARIKAAAWIADRNEIGGFGFMEQRDIDSRGTLMWVVYDMCIPEQVVSPGGQDFRPGDALEYRLEKGYPADSIRFSWHTHGNGVPFWSPTDENWILDMHEEGLPWVISLVTTSTFKEVELRLDVFEPFRLVSQEIDYIELGSTDVIADMRKVIEEKVKIDLTIAEMTKGLHEKGLDEIKVSWIDKDGKDTPVISGNVDLDRDDISEQDAARMLADVGEDLHITIIGEDQVDQLIKDEEDVQQDEILKELENEKVCFYCTEIEGSVSSDVCNASPSGEHHFVKKGAASGA